MSELDTIYVILGAQALAMFAVTVVYYALRLRIESRKEQSTRASLHAMVKYHSQRLDIEQEKLDLARGNANTQNVHVREHPRTRTPTIDEALTYIDALKQKERARSKIIDAQQAKPKPLTDDEFFAKIKMIRETYK